MKKIMKTGSKMVVLGVAAHPDDLDYTASGTFSKWIEEDASCFFLVCTDGSKGSDDPDMTEEKLIAIRNKEQVKAAGILGLEDVFFLNHKDTELVADHNLKREITRYIRKLKPDIVVTFDPLMYYSVKSGYINHTDHRVVGHATLDAVYPLARDRLTFPEFEKEGYTPHKVRFVYLINFENPNVIVDISNTFSKKIKVLSSHKSQVTPESLKRTKERDKKLGNKHGYKYAEGFIKIELR